MWQIICLCLPAVTQSERQRFFALFMIDCCIILHEERNTYAGLFSTRACSALGADSLPGVGQPGAAGHLSAGLSDRSLSFWGRSLGTGCPYPPGIGAACTVVASGADSAARASVQL